MSNSHPPWFIIFDDKLNMIERTTDQAIATKALSDNRKVQMVTDNTSFFVELLSELENPGLSINEHLETRAFQKEGVDE